jgi:hypothetical protein
MDNPQTIKELGFWLAALVAVAWFVKRDLWPFCMEQIKTRYTDTQQRHTKMLDLIDRLTEQVTTQRAQSIEALHTLAAQMTELAAVVNNLSHLVSTMTEREESRHPSHRRP